MFQSNLKVVADYFVQMRINKDYRVEQKGRTKGRMKGMYEAQMKENGYELPEKL